jgi:hypothetical protein
MLREPEDVSIDRAWHTFTVLQGKKEDIALLSGLVPTGHKDQTGTYCNIFFQKHQSM